MVNADQGAPRILQGRCSRCGACVLICQHGVLSLGDSGVQVAHFERCDSCAHCEEVCPEGALEVEFTIVWDDRSAPTGGGSL